VDVIAEGNGAAIHMCYSLRSIDLERPLNALS
jgi:hypothetical protein